MEISYNVVRNVPINKMYPVRRSLFLLVWAVALELYRHLSTEHFSLHNQTWTLVPSVCSLKMEISYNVVRNVPINKMYPVRRSLFHLVWAVAFEWDVLIWAFQPWRKKIPFPGLLDISQKWIFMYLLSNNWSDTSHLWHTYTVMSSKIVKKNFKLI